mgnify:FL=1|jgi:hypothetical protein
MSSKEVRKQKLRRFGVNSLVTKIVDLEDEQISYEKSLRAEIERIQLLGDWERFWSSLKLFTSLFEVIQKGFKK